MPGCFRGRTCGGFAAGRRGKVSEDDANLGSFEPHGEVFLTHPTGDAIPACADFEAGLAVDDVDPDGCEEAFESAADLLRQCWNSMGSA